MKESYFDDFEEELEDIDFIDDFEEKKDETRENDENTVYTKFYKLSLDRGVVKEYDRDREVRNFSIFIEEAIIDELKDLTIQYEKSNGIKAQDDFDRLKNTITINTGFIINS